MNKKFPLLGKAELVKLDDALHYAKMAELKDFCKILLLPEAGKKAELIKRITTFIATGSIFKQAGIPPKSRATGHPPQPLKPDALILYGSYKNDAKTRDFFKKLIGSHFHFTAFGIDWINERWRNANPPTYQEYADFWVTETDRRKHTKVAPKKEWALINFMQRTSKEQPEASQRELIRDWKQLRAQKAKYAADIIKQVVDLR